jgi:hypothetical protein
MYQAILKIAGKNNEWLPLYKPEKAPSGAFSD